MNFVYNFVSKQTNKKSTYLQFVTNAIISKIDDGFNIKLVKDGENDEIIQLMNNKLDVSETKKKMEEQNNKLSLEIEKNKIKEMYINIIKNKDIEIIKLKQQIHNKDILITIDKTLNNKFNVLNKYFDNKMSIQDKGITGENYLFDHFKKIISMSDGIIEKVNGKSNSGDLYMEYKNMKCCIESKNHIGDVSTKEINRFLKTDLQNPNYNCGLFISHKSGFPNCSNIKHFQIKIEKNKPCIFLSHIHTQITDIEIAIKVLNFLLTINYNNNKHDIVNQLKQNLVLFKELESNNNISIKNLNTSSKLISDNYTETKNIIELSENKLLKKRKRN